MSQAVAHAEQGFGPQHLACAEIDFGQVGEWRVVVVDPFAEAGEQLHFALSHMGKTGVEKIHAAKIVPMGVQIQAEVAQSRGRVRVAGGIARGHGHGQRRCRVCVGKSMHFEAELLMQALCQTAVVEFCGVSRLINAVIACFISSIKINIVVAPRHVDIENATARGVEGFHEGGVLGCISVAFGPEFDRELIADFFIGKPGPGSLSEAVQMGLPVIVVDNAWTMPQERYNAHWVRDNGLGIVASSFRHIDQAVAQLLADLDGHRARVRRVDNRALFEIPLLLERILDEAQAVRQTTAGFPMA